MVFRTFWPSFILVIGLEKLWDWSLGPMTLFQRPISVSIRLGRLVPFEDMTGLGISFEAGPGRGLDERWWESARERSGGMENLRKHSPVATSEECVEGG